jgi:hypothetical protein
MGRQRVSSVMSLYAPTSYRGIVSEVTGSKTECVPTQ